MPAERSAVRKRQTKETDVSVRLNLDGDGTAEIATGVAFLDHLLRALAVHARFDLDVKARGDLEVAARLHVQVEAGVYGQGAQQVVEKRNAGGDLGGAVSVEVEAHRHVGFLGLAFSYGRPLSRHVPSIGKGRRRGGRSPPRSSP